MCFTYVSFFDEFWVALSALWDRLICNPSTYMQSKHTFQFLYFFEKRLPGDLQMSHVFIRFWPNIRFLCEKMGSKNCFKKRCPSRVKQLPIPMPGGSRRGSLTCALCKQETGVWAAVEALFEIFAEKKWTGRKIGVKKWLGCWFVAKKTEWTVDFWKLRQV